MSKLSITGSKAVMDDVVEALHEQHRVHLSEYDGSWTGFDPGDPLSGADEVSERLVTVRSLESILDVDESDAGPSGLIDDASVSDRLESVRQEVNELDDRRDSIHAELETVRDELERMEPFTKLGLDLDLYVGYDTIQVSVGFADGQEVAETLETADQIEAYELFTADSAVAVFAKAAGDAGTDALQEALVGTEFADIELPNFQTAAEEHGGEISPEQYVAELEHREQSLESKLESVESELEDVKLDAAGFLLAVEEHLTIDVQKREAPLSFATTDRSFVAEGWVPTEAYESVAAAISAAVDGRVAVDELERIDFSEYAAEHGHGEPESDESAPESGPAAADPNEQEPAQARPDGGVITMDDEPPVTLDNPGGVSPFELLVEMVDLPRYDEFDPTVLLFLTFPVFFGFMIGDVGYGILYAAIGYWLWSSFDSDAIRSLGGVAMWAGGFTILFGILYGEFLGLHWVGDLYGGPVMHKGLQPAEIEYAVGWIVLTAVVGVLHVTVGYTLAFLKELRHGVVAAVFESGSWVLMMWGLWGWIFSHHLASGKPSFLIGAEAVFNGHPLPLGFGGFSEPVGMAAGVAFLIGLGMIWYVEPVEGVEALFLQVLVRGLSYTRIAAVLLAKAGMAFVVNLLVFGAYSKETGHGAEFHFLFFSDHTAGHLPEGAELIFAGLVNGTGPVELAVGWLAGILIFIVGHLIVLGLGVTSAGLQAVRLEYVEFFTEFYDGGGQSYEPFGYDRQYTDRE